MESRYSTKQPEAPQPFGVEGLTNSVKSESPIPTPSAPCSNRLLVGLEQPRCQPFDRLGLLLRQHVGVLLKRERDAAVSEPH